MAVTVTWDGTGVIDSADTTTGWATAKLEAGGGTPGVAVADGQIEGTGAVTTTSNSKRMVLYFDVGGGNELDFTSGGTEEGQFVYAWSQFLAAALLDDVVDDGYGIMLGSAVPTTSNHHMWTQYGADNYSGGWKRLVVDPTKPPSLTVGTAPTLSSIRYIGVCARTNATARFDNLIVDSMSVGSGLIVTGTSVLSLSEELLADEATNRYGIVTALNDSATAIELLGKLTIGDDAGTGATTVTDNSAKYFLAEPVYDQGGIFVPTIPVNALGISCVGNATGATDITVGTKVGEGDSASGISGISIIGNESYDGFITWDDANVDDNKWYGCSFEGLTGDLIWSDSSAHECIGNSFTGCSIFDPVGALQVKGCNFIDFNGPPNDLTASILWNEDIDIANCNFIANDTLEAQSTSSTAILHRENTTSPYTYKSLVMSGNTKDLAYSEWSPIEERTDRFGQDVRAATVSPDGVWAVFGSDTSPYLYIKVISDWSTATNPTTVPTSAINGIAFSPDGTICAVAAENTPYLYLYDTTASPWTKFTDPATIPTGLGLDAAFSNDGLLLACAHTTTPFITIYDASGHASGWTKITNPTTLPSGNGRGCHFSPDSKLLAVVNDTSTYGIIYSTVDYSSTTMPTIASRGNAVEFDSTGRYMAVAQNNSPRLITYDVNLDGTVTALTNPSTLPGGTGRDISFTFDGEYCAISHNSTPFISIYSTGTDPWVKQTNPTQLPVGSGSVGASCGFDPENFRLYVGSYDAASLDTVISYQNDQLLEVNLEGTSNSSTFRGPTSGVQFNKFVDITLSVRDINSTPIPGVAVSVFTGEKVAADRTELMNTLTGVDGIISVPYSYVSNQDIIVKVRNNSPHRPKRYTPESATGTVVSTGYRLDVSMSADPNVETKVPTYTYNQPTFSSSPASSVDVPYYTRDGLQLILSRNVSNGHYDIYDVTTTPNWTRYTNPATTFNTSGENRAGLSPTGDWFCGHHYSTDHLGQYDTTTDPWTVYVPGVLAGPYASITIVSASYSAGSTILGMITTQAGTETMRLVDTSTWAFLSLPPDLPTIQNSDTISFDPLGKFVLIGTPDYGTQEFIIYDTTTDPWTKTEPSVTGFQPEYIAWSADGKWLALSRDDIASNQELIVYSTSDWTQVSTITSRPTTDVRGLAFNPDSTQLAVTQSGSVILYNTSDWTIDETITPSPSIGTVTGVAYNNTGSQFCIGGDASPYIAIYDIT